MKKKLIVGLMSALLVVSVIAGCGSSKATSMDYASAEAMPVAEEAYATDDIYMNEAAMATEGSYDTGTAETPEEEATTVEGSETQSVAANRKLIKTVNMDVETEEFDTLMQKINQRIEDLGGYAESMSVSGRTYYDDSSNRYASMTIRVPSAKLDAFVSEVSEISNVTNKSESAEDITLQYVDTKSRRDSLKVEQERLQELLEEAEDLETIIALESRMTEVRYQLESYESQLRTYDNLVDFSTVYLYINEVKRLTPQVEESRWDKIRVGFAESIYDVAEGLLDFGVGFIIAIPYLIIWAIVITAIILIIRLIVKRNKKKKAQQIAEQQARTQAQQVAAAQLKTELQQQSAQAQAQQAAQQNDTTQK